MNPDPIYGLMAEFDSATDIVAAARRTHEAGYKKIDAYSPFPIEELAEAIGFHHNNVALVVLIGGLCGCATGYLLQWWVSVVAYPINVGGRPFHSWPSLSAVFGMLMLNGLPMPYHPVFNVPRFDRATQDKFFLIVFSSDPQYDRTRTRQFLEGLGPASVSEVPS
jgi:hypothetical protein